MLNERIPPTFEYVRACFLYELDTGKLFWKHRPVEHFSDMRAYNIWNTRFAGIEANSVDGKGYLRVQVLGVRYAVHRIIWLLTTGQFPQVELDHINHNRVDNRLENLREVSRVENRKNQRKRKDNISGVTGIGWNKGTGKWRARIVIDGKDKYFGRFDDIEKAARVIAEAYKANGYHENHGQ